MKILNKLVNETFWGILILIIVTVLSVILLEFIVRKIKPQITFTQATAQTEDIFKNSDSSAFSLRSNFIYKNLSLNSLGYRNDEFTVEKPKDTYRILFLGDSFVFSGGVSDNKDTLPQYLNNFLNRDAIKKIEVINAGFHDGFSPDSYYAYLKDEGFKLNPDMVITGIYLQNDPGDMKGTVWADIDENKLPQKVISLWRKVDNKGRLYDGIPPLRYRYPYLKDSQLWILFANWFDMNFPILRDKDEAKKIKAVESWYLLTYSNCIFRPECFPNFSAEFQRMIFVLKGIDRELKKKNMVSVFVFLPSKIQVNIDTDSVLSGDESLKLQKSIVNSFAGENIIANFLDLTPYYLSSDSARYYNYKETHWNAQGNQKSAEIIANYIRQFIK